jgi:tRNA(Ile)-lysidine synthase
MIDAAGLEKRVRAFAVAATPSLAGRRALLAVSGGGDSIAMAALLVESGLIDPSASAVAHFDHRLRGDDAATRDRHAVEALCARYGVALETSAWQAPMPGEAAARQARYSFLVAVAQERALPAVATGHTSDDQVETVLMHAMRGAGLHGLRGMLAEAMGSWKLEAGGAAQALIARPLLCLSRDETRAYCAARGLGYEDDASNEDPRFLRNRVRLELLPRMEAMMPDARAALLRMAAEASEAVAALDAIAAAALLPESDALPDGSVRLSRTALGALPAEVVPYAWRLALVRLLGDAREFDRRHYAILAGALDAHAGATFELPRGVVMTADAGELILSVGRLPCAAIDAGVELPLPFDGALGAWRIAVLSQPETTETAIELPRGCVMRGRRPGDRIQPRGMRGHKKLQDYYVDRKVPRRDRDAAPVIACGRDVWWTPFGAGAGMGTGERYSIEAIRVY